jgi:thiamine kinase-like enzyme
MKDKKAAKKIIKLAKKHPDWYTKQEVMYAKFIKKREKLKKDERKASDSDPRSRKADGLHSKSEQPKQPRKSSSSRIARLLHKAWSLVSLRAGSHDSRDRDN